jgi:hypothetical protein
MKGLNVETGEIYRSTMAVDSARAKGATVAMVSDKVAAAVLNGLGSNRAARRQQQFPRGPQSAKR